MTVALNSVYESIDELIDFAQKSLNLDPLDANITKNHIFALFNLDSYKSSSLDKQKSIEEDEDCKARSKEDAECAEGASNSSIDDILNRFFQAAYNANLLDPSEEDTYSDTIMGLLSANPSKIQQLLSKLRKKKALVPLNNGFTTIA